MARYGGTLGGVLVATLCCLLLLLLLPHVSAADFSIIVQYTELANTSFDMSDWSSVSGVTPKIVQHSSLTNGPYTLQGRSTVFTDNGRVATVAVLVDNITVSNGYIVIDNYFPAGSTITFSRIRGTVSANRPLIDASALYCSGIAMTVKNDDVLWPAVETVVNTQVLVRTSPRLDSTSALFVLNSSATSASAMVAIAPASAYTSLTVDSHSLLAVDYSNCSGCTNGLLYTAQSMLVLQDASLLRLSNSLLADVPAGTPLVNLGSGVTMSLTTQSLLLVENVTAAGNSVFRASSIATRSGSTAVLRYVSAASLGATLGAGASYKQVSLSASEPSASTLGAAVPIAINECAAACVQPSTVDDSCSCSCPAATSEELRYMSLCTYVRDAVLVQYPDACAAGCATCTAASVGSCTVCRDGYMLSGGVCYQKPVSCSGTCALCTSTGVCQECPSGYAISASKTCVACTASNCGSCPDSPNTCTVCQDGYALSGGVCTAICAVAHCVSCVPSNTSQCAACERNYKVSATGTCDGASGQVRVPSLFIAVALFVVYIVW